MLNEHRLHIIDNTLINNSYFITPKSQSGSKTVFSESL